ncbi:hypothetical protein [Primorskyibacter marinus]|uniref:hypothetical protein n=1 Tax=Primorskyibacter marinus TaxID=1977320 RepID=UPI0018E5829E|nr:hypothetical protein [Primorskyibacter marinus]
MAIKAERGKHLDKMERSKIVNMLDWIIKQQRTQRRPSSGDMAPGALFQKLIPFHILDVDHASYGRFQDRPIDDWDVWLNVLIVEVEVEDGASEPSP